MDEISFAATGNLTADPELRFTTAAWRLADAQAGAGRDRSSLVPGAVDLAHGCGRLRRRVDVEAGHVLTGEARLVRVLVDGRGARGEGWPQYRYRAFELAGRARVAPGDRGDEHD